MHRYENLVPLQDFNVREMSLNDGHTFVTPEQIKDEFQRTLIGLSMLRRFQLDWTIVSFVIP